MEITYYGHSCFKLKASAGTVVIDPYDSAVGFSLPSLSADIVVSSHDHFDHHAVDKIKSTTRREKPFMIDQPGEYEVAGISIFGVPSFHDASEGSERGKNVMFIVYMDHVRVCHLGDLGHLLTDQQKTEIGEIDVLLVPVGGVFTINAEQAVKTITALNPSYVIPMHYKTDDHDQGTFVDVQTVDSFLNEYGVIKKPVPALDVDVARLPEETEVVVLERR